MDEKNSAGYGAISRFNHWIIAVAMIGMIGLGLYIGNFVPNPPEAEALLQGSLPTQPGSEALPPEAVQSAPAGDALTDAPPTPSGGEAPPSVAAQGEPEGDALLQIHQSIGLLVLLYGIWRIGWRLYNGFLTPVGLMPPWQHSLAKVTHGVLLAGILVMPLSGVVLTLFEGDDVSVFGMLVLPGLTENELIAEIAEGVHALYAYAMIVFIFLHIAGALKHHIIDRDVTLVRMTSGKASR